MAARFRTSRTGPSNSPAYSADAPQPEQRGVSTMAKIGGLTSLVVIFVFFKSHVITQELSIGGLYS